MNCITRTGRLCLSSLAVLLFLVFSSSGLFAQKVLKIDVKDVSLEQVLELVKEQTDYKFSYTEALEADKIKVSVTVSGQPAEEFFKSFFPKYGIEYKIMGKLVALTPVSKNAQRNKIDVKGVVLDKTTGEPLPGAVVYLKGNNSFSAVTDLDGVYTISGIPSDGILVCQMVGMQQAEIEVAGRSKVDVSLDQDIISLDDVVVTGYQTISKERAASSFAVISKESIDEKISTDIMSRIEGSVAGMTSYRGDIQIRGKSTISGNDTPLYVVDGVPYEGSLSAINPADVVNITVLKDASAASIYGARSANGVIVITTRSGHSGPTRVNYNGTVKITPLPDPSYQNLMSSSEFIDFQRELFNINPGSVQGGYYVNEVRSLLFDHKNGVISDAELETQLDVYRNRDNTQQIKDAFLRNASVSHVHNLSLSGGSDKYNYALSFQYNQNFPYERVQSSDMIGFNLKNTFKFYKWFKADIGLLGNISKYDYSNGFTGMTEYMGGRASYINLFDEEGNPIHWYQTKSQEEIDRLKGEGLLDETYYPLEELDKERIQSKSSYLNLNANFNFIIAEGLSFDLRYSNDFGFGYTKRLYDKDSWTVKTMINDATQIKDGEIIQNIPTGGQVQEGRTDKNSYTLRAQVNYNKTFAEKHNVSVIAGAERRAVKSSGTNTFNVGYDDNSLQYKVIDEKMLGKTLVGTESLNGRFTYSRKSNSYSYTENRYVSFYANASYSFNDRFTATASIRMDQSNLFGTDPKYQYRPLWSAGGQYRILDERNVNWIDRLSVRLTYGINGNIAKMSGPFLTVVDAGINGYINDYSSKVKFPPNSGLRWEKTGVWNLALDFNLFKSRLSGTIEFYNKNTTDLLHEKTYDPSYGWTSVTVNYGDMYNRGVEVSLSSVNVTTRNFMWKTNFNFSYNKNMLTRIENSNSAPIYYVQNGQIREGMSMSTLYSTRWAGLSEEGKPLAYNKNGEIVSSFADLTIDDLVCSGVATPPYMASLSNYVRWKGLSMSILWTYYGGHVLRGVSGAYITGTALSTNQDRLTGNFWRKPGDENNPETTPAIMKGVNSNIQNLWKAADKHVQKADYFKLNSIVFNYNLSKRLLQSTFIKDVKLSLQIDNLCKIVFNDQGLDPESWTGVSLSPSRGRKQPVVFSFGLNLKF